jgi:hypothetical protein
MKTYNVKLEMEVEVQVEDGVTLEQAREIVQFEKECRYSIKNDLIDKMIDIDVVSYEVKR